MSIITALMKAAAADTELLLQLDAQGDQLNVARDVEFFFRAPSADKANLAASFINDYQYGVASFQDLESSPSVLVVVHMPVEQHAIQCVAGFMVCLCELFGLDYDGWGCAVTANTE